MKLGLKLWTTNLHYIDLAAQLFHKGVYDYIELFFVPESGLLIEKWATLNIPVVVHAPHTVKGLNPAIHSAYPENLRLANETFECARKLQSSMIIFHPGMGGSAEETIRQLRGFGHASDIVIENKPYHSLTDPTLLCRGSNPEEMKLITESTKTGFCLDVGHAICSANSIHRDPFEYLQEFLTLKPSIIHLSDGTFDSVLDSHLNFGKGTFPLKQLLELIPKDLPLSVETNKNYSDSLRDFEEDIGYLRNLVDELR
ncbi:MAG: TIM barrel protein [Candidatus Margulisiibacteriota bacterium]